MDSPLNDDPKPPGPPAADGPSAPMELRELAERILFGRSLEEKLACPEVVSDERPGSAIANPHTPGRPPTLEFRDRSSPRVHPPGIAQLHSDRDRGILLHFFANHELLATELMALVLLRFPDAPAAFRRGVLRTLRDEQRHTRLYLDRMKACGVHFGELPVSGYFWRAVSSMRDPMDYVTGLSLTFEQANLDYSRHFARAFRMAGDDDTARLLEGIYHDEIGHVAHGLKWFRMWKHPAESDWDAFRHRLQFPLSPSRAKGFELNVEGRLNAGLDPAFVEALRVHTQSRGRTPRVHFFNPFAEASIALGRKFTPSHRQTVLSRDLATLPLFLARQDDVVLAPPPSPAFLARVRAAGFPLVEFIDPGRPGTSASSTTASAAPSTLAGVLGHRKLAGLAPWAWAPDSVGILSPLMPLADAGPHTPDSAFNQSLARLYTKSWGALFLRDTLLPRVAGDSKMELPASSWLCGPDVAGIAARGHDEVLEHVRAIRDRGHHRVVLKQDLGLAGQNALRLWEPAILEVQHRWIRRSLESGWPIVVEPWLERVVDFSFQFDRTPEGLRLVGITRLLTDSRGQFVGNVAGPGDPRHFPAEIGDCFRHLPRIHRQLSRLIEHLQHSLESVLSDTGFTGALGVDAFVFRDSTGASRIKPVVEINPRTTMGRVTVELHRQVQPGSRTEFRVVNLPALQEAGDPDFRSWDSRMSGQHPLRLSGAPRPRIESGYLPLTDPGAARIVLATMRVARGRR